MSQPLINPSSKPPKEKTPDTRKWYQKKRFNIPIGILVFSSFINAVNGGSEGNVSQPVETQTQEATQTQQPEVSTEETGETSVTVVSLRVPDLVGQNTDDALDELIAMGFTEASAQDATYEERLVLLRSNWFVCEMKPAAGTTLDSDKTIVLLSVKNSENCPSGSANQGADSDEGETSAPATSAFGNLTATQIAMNEVIAEYKGIFDAAENDLQRGNVRLERDEAICSAIGSGKVSNWSGVVEDLGATSEGYAYLKVAMGKNITLETWNNEFSDLFDDTLVERGTALYDTLLGLQEGQIVTFSGEFIGGDGSCLDTKNLTEFFAIERPEFVFRFTSVAP
jgi:hypothetical protein